MTLSEYIDKISTRYKAGISTEHSYRGDLQNLLETLASDVMVTNEPTRVACGAPDYIITKRNIPVGYIEAKDIGKPLDSKDYKEQFDRYRASLNNLIITDYLEFRLFRDGVFVLSVTIGKTDGNKIIALTDNFKAFTGLIKDFCTYTGQTIKSASKLSKMMAGKARLLANVIEKALAPEENSNIVNEPQNLNLHNQYESFKQILIHDITPKTFADVYAQTIAYGMFAARLHDPSLENFSRQEAAELIPKSNPFLRKLFQYVAGYDLDDRIKWIVDALADIFRATNVAELLKDFGKSTQQHDPIIHFYETFLSEYDPALRKSRGVWYTPAPVVNFIVRAVDDILKTEFGLPQGLAETSKTRITVDVQGKKVEQEVHRVQILDPAAGTGTFLAEVVKHIYKQFKGQQGVWSNYVEDQLIPRLNGFEILMASYAMAHLKLDLLLRETGYIPKKEQRFRVYLTNSLEEHHQDTGTLFASWLSTEANEANHVKRDTPVMVVLGNPPYSGISTNKSKWIINLIEDYKYVDGVHFGEKKHWLQDDYVKFIRFGQHFINKNGEGILAFINNHSFLDNTTFRGMRWNLLNTFDKIYVLDLHGNSKRKEAAPDGSPDKNVFDIQQGVSINIFIKSSKRKNKPLAEVYKAELWGERISKYNYLNENGLKSVEFKKLIPVEPYYFFVERDFTAKDIYQKGIAINELFTAIVTGVLTARDSLVIDFDSKSLKERIEHFCNQEYSDDKIRNDFFGDRNADKYLQGDTRGWKLGDARRLIQNNDHDKLIRSYSYRPFDSRQIYYSSDMVDWSREKYMKHMLSGSNLALDICKQLISKNYTHVFIIKDIADDSFVSNKSRERGYVMPLYLFPDNSDQQTINDKPKRTPNLNKVIVDNIASSLSIEFTNEKELTGNIFAPIDILDYIYAVLHSPAYREKYKEFLKIDFPRVPYPKDVDTFWKLVKLGSELRQIHLLESHVVNKFITTYLVTGSNEVAKLRYEDGKVWINSEQYFDKVPQVSWEFYIGGYQPAQKWLKDRKGRTLSFEDIMHYQKIIVALSETDRIMKEIDKIDFMV